MNINQFKTLNSTVLSVEKTNTGIQIWVQYEGGREGSYQVNDPSFPAREGHQFTAILYGAYAVAVYNRSTNCKIQLLNGWDLLGDGPQGPKRSFILWVGWAVFLVPFSNFYAGAFIDHPHHYFGNSVFAYLAAYLAAGIISLGSAIGIPAWFFLRPWWRCYQHKAKVKQTDAAIAKLFNPL